jgi:hypothetical protein
MYTFFGILRKWIKENPVDFLMCFLDGLMFIALFIVTYLLFSML